MSRLPTSADTPKTLTERLRANWKPVGMRLHSVDLRRAPWVLPGRWAALVAGGLVLVVLVAVALDNEALGWSNALPQAILDFFRWVTRYGQSDWLLIPTGVLVIVIALGDWTKVDRRIAAAWMEVAGLALAFFIVVAVPGLVIDIIKPIVGRWRPELLTDGAFGFSPFTFSAAYYSFPSGHATTVAAVTIFALFALPRRWGIAVAAIAGVIAVSRVMVSAHHPSDVTGGVLAGLGIGYLLIRVLADAGIGFVCGPDGDVRPRLDILRRLRHRREGGLAIMFPNLWVALERG